jgi:uncharacterized protein YjbJ (UPF0337 family)
LRVLRRRRRAAGAGKVFDARVEDGVFVGGAPAGSDGGRRDYHVGETAAAGAVRFGQPHRRGIGFADDPGVLYEEVIMASEDVAAGKVKQVKGKANDVAGAIKGDTGQQIKGKIQKGVGKVQEALGKSSRKNPK